MAQILEFYAKNVKGLHEVTVRPTGPVIEVCGENESGKSSLIDSIMWAIKGARSIQSKPIRKGEDKAIIELDLGPVQIKRTFSDRGPDMKPASSLVVRNADGGIYKSPHACSTTWSAP